MEYQNDSATFCWSRKKAIGHYTMPVHHFHDGFELYYLLAGERYYFIKDRTFFVKKGDLVLINPYDLHKTIDTGVPNHERVLIKFNREFIATPHTTIDVILAPLFKNNVISCPIQLQGLVEDLLDKINHEIQNKKTGFEICLQYILMQLLLNVYRYTEQNTPKFLEHPSPIHEKISEIVQYLNQNYAEDLNLSTIAGRFFISPFYLSKVFKQVTGFTFVEYLSSVRIKEAQKLLRESKLNVLSIAEKVGFGNIAHFGRVFKAVTGYPPLQYRKLNRIQD